MAESENKTKEKHYNITSVSTEAEVVLIFPSSRTTPWKLQVQELSPWTMQREEMGAHHI